MLEKLHIVKMGNVFLKNILIAQQLYHDIILKGMNEMQHLIALRMQIHDVLIVLDNMLVNCDIDQAKQNAFSQNGEYLSTSYFNNYSDLLCNA
jgi:hypothetical protein